MKDNPELNTSVKNINCSEEIIEYFINNNTRFGNSLWSELPQREKEIISKESEKIIIDEFNWNITAEYYLGRNIEKSEKNLRIFKYLEQLNERIFETKLKSYMGDSQHSLLHKKFPKLVNELDQEGLLSSKKVELVSDAIKYDGHIIGFDERIDYDLRKKLIEKINEGIEVKFKLSNFDITPIENYKHTIRKAKVYGRPFNADLLNKRLKDTSSHFVYQRYSEGEKIYSSFSLSNEKKFEVLKTQRDDRNFILTENIPSYTETPNYPITYIFHSDIKFDNVFFDHIDSSLLIYNKENFLKRSESSLKDKVKANFHIKLFRINHNITLNEWVEFLYLTYPLNEMVWEFVTNKEYNSDTYTEYWGF